MEDLPMAQRQNEIQKGMQEPMVYAASVNPDIMYLHEVMKVPDHDQFKKAMDKELQDHIAHKHWEVVPRSEVPKGTRVLDMVWAMWRKRHIDMREVYKWKAQLNVHGGQQQHGINYWEMYAPVITWQTIHFFFILAIIRDWRIHQIDFVLVYTQAPAEVPLYMKFPHGYDSKYLPESNRSLLPSGGLMADVPCLDHSLDGCKGYPDDVQTTKHARRTHARSRCARTHFGAHVSQFGASSARF